MNTMKPFFVGLLILAATMATLTPAIRAGGGDDDDNTNIDITAGFWWYIHIGRFGNTCHNTYWGKKVCQKKGPNLTCCKHSCVNLSTHKYNCGSCGASCPFPKQCCSGKCVNVILDPYNCGKCSKKCPHKGQCRGGMCNYAS